jgi:UDP-N-acetylglucosamine--N-acetylmuramyl-(pentapeptide) pyrophosphoryl-undecaprenol N-acetylglucosamine transferase
MNVWFTGGGTGGHLYPGLAIARALRHARPTVQPYFIGARRGIEREVLPTTEFPHLLLDLHPLYRPQVWRNWRTLRGAVGAWRALSRAARERPPALIVGTGGYAAGLAAAWGWAHGVPVVQHVGDAIPGLTARWTARIARASFLGYPEAAAALGATPETCVDTGNPIEPPPQIRPDPAAARARWGFPPGATVVLVFGGSQGARALNRVVSAWVERGLPEAVHLIWATGRGQFDAYAPLARADVQVVPFLSPIAEAYAAADLALVRGGMMGTSELCAWGLPMLIVPLPTAAQDHQTANARVLEAAGAARHLPEHTLSVQALDAAVRDLLADPARRSAMAAAARARGRPHAAAEIADRVGRFLDAPR